MVTNRIIFFATSVQPNPEEIDYWVDLSDNPYGGSIKYFNGTEWVRLAASGGAPDLSNYYTKTQVNKLLNDKANISDVDSKVDDEEVKDVIKDIQFNTSNPNGITMVMFKYDGSDDSISLPIASTGSAGIVTSKDFLDFVKQHQLQELHTEMIDTFADIRAKYQKKLIAGLNIEIDQETNVISASGDLAVQWDNITNKPDFKPVATSGDYNDLINKLKPGKDVSISDDNVISIAIDSDELNASLSSLNSKIVKETETARAAEAELSNAITTEKDRAESAENTISTSLSSEISRSTEIDAQHTSAINKEIQDRKDAITTEVNDRNAAILVETNRAKAKEEELDNKITDHTSATNAALALKADKSDTYTKAQVDAKLSGAYKVKGSSTFEDLPTEGNVVGDVYNITNSFNLDGDHYDAGTNVVWTEDGWDSLSGSFDTTAIEGSIQEVADDLAQETLDRIQADTTINNSVTAVSSRVTVAEDKLDVIQADELTTGSIANALKQAKDYTDENKLELGEVTGTAYDGDKGRKATAITNSLPNTIVDTLEFGKAYTDYVQLKYHYYSKVFANTQEENDHYTAQLHKHVNLPAATTSAAGVMSVADKVKLDAIEAEANKYILPAATTTTLGGIIVGDRLSIDDTGKLVATYTYTLPTASNTVLGGVKIGSNITNTNGTISLTKANVTSALGVDPTTTYVKKAGDTMTGALTNSSTISGSKLISTVATGTAPIQVASTTLCTNLNADMVDGYGVSNSNTDSVSIKRSINSVNQSNAENWIKLCTLPLTSQMTTQDKRVVFEIVGGTDVGEKYAYYAILTASTRVTENVELRILNSVDTISIATFIAGYIITSDKVEIWIRTSNQWGANTNIVCKYASTNAEDILSSPATTQRPSNFVLGNIKTLDAPDWYGVSWSETSSNPDCTRIGNMDMHRTLPIQSMMKPFVITNYRHQSPENILPIDDNFSKSFYSTESNTQQEVVFSLDTDIMIRIPEFWYTDEYVPSSKTHNLKICPHAKPGWYHHKEAYVGAYELCETSPSSGKVCSAKGLIPLVGRTREVLRKAVRGSGFDGEAKWNLYTYEEHRAICHLFLVEYATRNSQKAVNTELTPEGFRQGGLGSGCTTGTATINGAQTWSFIPTGSSDSLGSGSGEVTVTIQQTDSSGSNTSTITRKCNRYRGIENPFGHIWKHTDDVISVYGNGHRTWYKSVKPNQFATNKNTSYKPFCASTMVSNGYKTEIKATPTCDFFATSVSGGSETTYWCDYNWVNTDTSEHCLLIGGISDSGGGAGLFYLYSNDGVGRSNADIGSRLTYLPWAE